jgi:hypothetical protein
MPSTSRISPSLCRAHCEMKRQILTIRWTHGEQEQSHVPAYLEKNFHLFGSSSPLSLQIIHIVQATRGTVPSTRLCLLPHQKLTEISLNRVIIARFRFCDRTMDLQTLSNLFATTYNPDPNVRKAAELQIRKVSWALAESYNRAHN